MSGSKRWNYEVISREELQRRADEARGARCKQKATRYAWLAKELERLVGCAPEVMEPDVKTSDNLITWEKRLDFVIKESEKQVAEETEKTIRKRIETEHKQRIDSANSILQQFQKVSEIRQIRNSAWQATLDIAALNTEAARMLRAKAATIETEAQLNDLTAQIQQLAEFSTQIADQEFVENALADAITELGYEIGEGFTLTDYGPVAYAHSPKSNRPAIEGYDLRFQVGAGQLYTRIVSRQDSTPAQDELAEEATCATFFAVADELEERGIKTELIQQRKPGERPVDRVMRPLPAERQSGAAPVKQQPRRIVVNRGNAR